ncbi:MAG: sigma-54-dependent Fis family transcriptional regulator [Myxococcales bacterium]|nr:sigma-54-dependent Fis family transcriptional regulator [Myxococcales bacterium]
MTGESAAHAARVLVVDDDSAVAELLTETLVEAGYRAEYQTDARQALAYAREHAFDLVISDIEMPGLRGVDLMRALQHERPDQLVMLITAFGSIDLAVEAVHAGACDFIAKPFNLQALLLSVARALRERRMRREIVRLRSSIAGREPSDIVARSPAMRRVLDLAQRAARTDASVVLTGESGVGKGAIAQLIHSRSARSARPLMHINCAALPPTLVESELFGVVSGAFTDARTDRAGLLREASGGSLFLDELAEMPIESQPKLLQAIETREVRPVGASQAYRFDVRIIAATNRPLLRCIENGTLREDLYYRLAVIQIDIPPLRERTEDIEPLVDAMLGRACKAFERQIVGVAEPAMRWLLTHDWPGNVRELANVIERAVALTDHDVLQLDDLALSGPPMRAPAASASVAGEGDADGFLERALSRKLPLSLVERAYIEQMVEACEGNKLEAARALGIDRRTLYRKLADSD